MAALGELLFYIASQEGDPRGAAAWQLPPNLPAQVTHLVRPEEDPIVQVCM